MQQVVDARFAERSAKIITDVTRYEAIRTGCGLAGWMDIWPCVWRGYDLRWFAEIWGGSEEEIKDTQDFIPI